MKKQVAIIIFSFMLSFLYSQVFPSGNYIKNAGIAHDEVSFIVNGHALTVKTTLYNTYFEIDGILVMSIVYDMLGSVLVWSEFRGEGYVNMYSPIPSGVVLAYSKATYYGHKYDQVYIKLDSNENERSGLIILTRAFEENEDYIPADGLIYYFFEVRPREPI